MRDQIRMVFSLTTICVGAALLLAFAKDKTALPIKLSFINNVKKPSIQSVLTEYDNDPVADFKVMDMGKDAKGKTVELEIFPAKKDGQLIAVAFDSTAKGFNGPINVMVGVTVDGALTGVSIMTHSETPGLGARCVEPDFRDQFKGLTLSDGVNLSTNGGTIDAISGASYSSIGVVTAVKKALELFPKVLKEVS